ncbi:uncharacterized protein LOC128238787 [Mya arenaria]|uniref:uncharacterized protein LOC128238787 n=1 Tax=Mya arenaria TaxID=6604 RepID=UPI0022DF585C|nr:uncharacterized protein LOC128238787 [Mya arenaria]
MWFGINTIIFRWADGHITAMTGYVAVILLMGRRKMVRPSSASVKKILKPKEEEALEPEIDVPDIASGSNHDNSYVQQRLSEMDNMESSTACSKSGMFFSIHMNITDSKKNALNQGIKLNTPSELQYRCSYVMS